MTEPARSFEQLAQDLERLEEIAREWEPGPRGTLNAVRETVEAISAEAFRRLIRRVREQAGGKEALLHAVEDEWVRGVLTYHGILRPPQAPSDTLEPRVEAALARVRPALAQHGGDVQLVEVVSAKEVHIRLIGGCDGCSFSDATVHMGIETEIRKELPELEIVKVKDGKPRDGRAAFVPLTELTGTKPVSSPFARPWQDACGEADVPEGALHTAELPGASVLIARVGGELKAYPNACVHLGMPLDTGELKGGVLTCRYHGFAYQLSTGECLTAPDVQLPPYPVKSENGRIYVQVTS